MTVEKPQTEFEKKADMICEESRYLSCDPRWQSDFDAVVDPLIYTGELQVVHDFRKEVPAAPAATEESRRFDA